MDSFIYVWEMHASLLQLFDPWYVSSLLLLMQAIMQSPFSNGGSPTPDGLTETRFTYVPAVTAGGDGSGGQGVDPNPAAGISQVAAGAGKTGREGEAVGGRVWTPTPQPASHKLQLGQVRLEGRGEAVGSRVWTPQPASHKLQLGQVRLEGRGEAVGSRVWTPTPQPASHKLLLGQVRLEGREGEGG